MFHHFAIEGLAIAVIILFKHGANHHSLLYQSVEQLTAFFRMIFVYIALPHKGFPCVILVFGYLQDSVLQPQRSHEANSKETNKCPETTGEFRSSSGKARGGGFLTYCCLSHSCCSGNHSKIMTFRWNRGRVFYGWWIVAASFVTALYAGGAVFYGFTAFFEPIAKDMGWSYTQVSLAASLRGMEMGLLSPFIGILVDRLGPRKLIFGGGTAAATGLALLSTTTSLPMFYGAFALLAIGMSACTVTVLMTAVANWFRQKIGIATGIAICGFGFSGLLVPFITKLITAYEWRTAAIILAIGMVVIVLPLSLVFRHKPEHYGYLPDGETRAAAHAENQAAVQTTEVNVRAKEAIRGSTFWRLGLSYMYHMMVVSATVTHVMPYLGSVGVSRSLSSLVAMGIPLASVAGRLGLGWLGDKYDKRVVASVGFAIMGIGMLCFGHASAASIWVLVPFLVLMGIGYGGGNALRPSLVREYFGRANFGTVFGVLMGIGAIGAIAGPTLAGWAYDNWGAYQGIWYLLAGLATVAVTLVLSIPSSTAKFEQGRKP